MRYATRKRHLACVALVAAATLWALWLTLPRVGERPLLVPMLAAGEAATERPMAVPASSPTRLLASVANDPVADSVVDAPTAELCFRLQGIHPKAPWQAPLRFYWQGNDDTAETGYRVLRQDGIPDPAGVLRIASPSVQASARNQRGYLRGNDSNYLPFDLPLAGPLDPAQENPVEVQAVCWLTGRVVTAHGEPVSGVRMEAYCQHGDAWVAAQLGGGEARTGPDGRYRLPVAPDLPCLLVAVPGATPRDQFVNNSWHEALLPGQTIGAPAVDHGPLLPAGRTVLGVVGQPNELADLVLGQALTVTGRVCWEDGSPVAAARVWLLAQGRQPLPAQGLCLTSQGLPLSIPWCWSDADGRFALLAAAGVPCEVRIDRIEGCELVGEHPVAAAMAGQTTELRLRGPLGLRVLDGAGPVAHASVEVGLSVPGAEGLLRLPDLRTDAGGMVRVVCLHPRLSVRAEAAATNSAWVELATGPRRMVDLQQAAGATGEVMLVGPEDLEVTALLVRWTRDDGQSGSRRVARDGRKEPFRLRLATGRYQLQITAESADLDGGYLQSLELPVTVTSAAQTVPLPVVFGGCFTLAVLDRHGLQVAGMCMVQDGAGGDWSGQFCVADGDGGAVVGRQRELLGDGLNRFAGVLPAGEYWLELDCGELGTRRQQLTIRSRETTAVRVRFW